jgi:cytochrome c-type biogenesis protein CcmH/NrfG
MYNRSDLHVQKGLSSKMSDTKQERWTPRNPLGVIALFVFLIETVATISLRTMVNTPAAFVLVWFIVLYPTCIAVVFFLLLWFRREALFGPMDFADQREFSRLLRATEIKVVDKATTLSTKQMYYVLGVGYRSRKEWNDARDAFETAIKLDSRNTSALLGLADTALGEAEDTQDQAKKKELLKEALQNSNKAVEIDPSFAAAYLTRATVNATLDVGSNLVREDLERADDLNEGLRETIAKERAFKPLHKDDWFRSRFPSAQVEGV